MPMGRPLCIAQPVQSIATPLISVAPRDKTRVDDMYCTWWSKKRAHFFVRLNFIKY